MSFRKPCHMPFRKLIPPFTLTANYASGTFFGKYMKIVMSTNLEYIKRERQRKRESRRQGSKAQREK